MADIWLTSHTLIVCVFRFGVFWGCCFFVGGGRGGVISMFVEIHWQLCCLLWVIFNCLKKLWVCVIVSVMMASHLHFCGNNLLVAVCLACHSYTLWPWPWLYFKDMAVSGCWNWSFEPQDSFVSGPVQTLNDCDSHEWLSDPWMIVSHMDHFMPLFASANCFFSSFFLFSSSSHF